MSADKDSKDTKDTKEAFSITFMSGPRDGHKIVWNPSDGDEMILTIGRRPGCDVLIDYDTHVSRLHAQLIYDPHRRIFYLEDMGSRNGTILNNIRMRGRAPLQSGVMFRVGGTWLRLTVSEAISIDEDVTGDRFDYPF